MQIVLEKIVQNSEKNIKLILKSEQRFRRNKRSIFTESVNKIVFSANDDEVIQSIDVIEIYAYGMSIDLLCKKKEIKCNSIIKRYRK